MKRTTIFLDAAVERDLQALARQASRPLAALVREALAEYVSSRQPGTPARPGFVACGSSGHHDGAERHEEILWRDDRAPAETIAPPAPVRYARKRR